MDDLYYKIYSIDNLILAWKKARKGKTKRNYVVEFEKELGVNLRKLRKELKDQTYHPRPLKTFILHDPKIRKISKSDFRDRIVHHAIFNAIGPIFEKSFIYDSCANRINKGSLFALKRFQKFKRKVTNNLKIEAFCLKADIRHYFKEVDHKILLKIIERKIKDSRVIWLIERILENNVHDNPQGKGMPLGNMTSQFFANVYLHELDYFLKHKLKAKFYIRYVDDFIILNKSKEKLECWEKSINKFVKRKLKLQIHSEKSNVYSISNGIDFIGFRNFYYHRLLRKRSSKNIDLKIKLFANGKISEEKIIDILEGWNAYAKWGDTHNLRQNILKKLILLHERNSPKDHQK